MLLTTILDGLDYAAKPHVISDTEVSDIVYDSRKAAAGTMFVCLVGAVMDGHSYAPDAYENGCRVFLAERELALPDDAVQVIVPNTRHALALASAALFGHPARSLAIIGVTGTKGKTTVASLLADILNAGGISTAYIGTTGIRYAGVTAPTRNTTPESYELHKAFRKMIDAGVSAVVMEVSSQAVYMHRIDGIHFHIGIFTNLSRDHIGGVEHPTFAHYMQCKAELFRQCRYGIFNSDDPHYTDMVKNSRSINATFGMDAHIAHDTSARDLKKWKSGNILGTVFTCKSVLGEERIELRMPGEFNVYNALAAIAAANRMGIGGEVIKKVLSRAAVRGRFEIVEALDHAVTVIDYAHNRVSMEAALNTLRSYEPKRLVVLFGSVGGRSKERRAELGEVASRLADYLVITSDNPDFEPPQDIIDDIERAVENSGCFYKTFVDRREAVRFVIDNARDGDCILFAGKGHEQYQIIEGEYQHYDEREEIFAAAGAHVRQ